MYLITMLVMATQCIVGCQDGREDTLELVNPEDVPYVVLVLLNNHRHFCGGTLLQAEWALTSAHCLYDTSGVYTEEDTSVTVLAGVSGLKNAEKEIKSGQAQARQSVKIIVYTYYSWWKNFVNDLVLVKVKPPLNLTDRVGVAPLFVRTSREDSEDGLEACEGYGFGVSTERMSEGAFPLKRQRRFVSKGCDCLSRISTAGQPYSVTQPRNTFLCDEDEAGAAGACPGDGGGPLVCGGQVRGVTSALFHTQTVYTDLCYYTRWLHNIVPSVAITHDNCTLVD